MIGLSPSHPALEALLKDAIQRDLTTARRAALLQILWNERFLSRSQLMARVQYRLGRNCFGVSSWEDAFYRDMRVVKQAFLAGDLILEFTRSKQGHGYHVRGQGAISPGFNRMIKASAAEVDARQINIYHSLSPAARFQQGCSTSDTAREVVVYRIGQENPRLTPQEARRLALRRAYSA